MRIAFLGTPDSAVPTLDALAAKTSIEIVITQPDRPKGRSGTPSPPPVKAAAQRHGLRVAQPEDRQALVDVLESAGEIDAAVVVAYGRILSPEVLQIPRIGTLNAHFSLLPRWRGAAPVARALIGGDPMTGVTIIELDEGLDTGPVLTAQAVDILSDDDLGSLTTRLARLASRLMVTVLPRYVDGVVVPVSQSDDGLTYAAKVEKADRRIGPGMTAADFVNHVRGLSPAPGAALMIDGVDHKVLSARRIGAEVASGRWSGSTGKPVVGVADGSVELLLLQAPGRKVITGEDWVRGHPAREGDIG